MEAGGQSVQFPLSGTAMAKTRIKPEKKKFNALPWLIWTTLLTGLTVGGFLGWTEYQKHLLAEYYKNKETEIYQSLTLEQKIGQLFLIAVPGKDMNERAAGQLKTIQPGSVIIFDFNYDVPEHFKKSKKPGAVQEKGKWDPERAKKRLTEFTRALQEQSLAQTGVPLLTTIDQEGGRVYRVRAGVTQFPGAMAIGQMDVPRFSHYAGFITSYELLRQGINTNLAPVLDINDNPANPVINTRSFGSSAERVIKMAIPYLTGMVRAGAVGAVKHFPGHGSVDKDSHVALPVLNKTLEQLRAQELKPFEAAVKEKSPMVMTAHILVPEVDPDHVVTVSKKFLTDILRREMKYEGIIISDALEMAGVRKRNGGPDLGWKALNAGVDILLFTSWGKLVRQDYEYIVNKVKGLGKVPAHMEASVRRIIQLKLRKGYFHHHKSPLVKANDILGRKYDYIWKSIDKTYRTLLTGHRKDKAFEGDWNRMISVRAVRGLYGPINGLPANPKNTWVFYRHKNTRARALEEGVPKPQVLPVGKFYTTVRQVLKDGGGGDQVFAAEFGSKFSITNRYHVIWWRNQLRSLAKEFGWKLNKKTHRVENQGPRIVGLYAGTPFVQKAFLWAPDRGGVAATFSPTPISREEAVVRLFRQKKAGLAESKANPIPEADLILP